MSTTIENKKSENKKSTIAATASKTVKRSTTTRRAPQAQPASTDQIAELSVTKRPASELTRLIFMTLLGSAACIALVGVVSQAGGPGTSPDDAPPAVIIELAD